MDLKLDGSHYHKGGQFDVDDESPLTTTLHRMVAHGLVRVVPAQENDVRADDLVSEPEEEGFAIEDHIDDTKKLSRSEELALQRAKRREGKK